MEISFGFDGNLKVVKGGRVGDGGTDALVTDASEIFTGKGIVGEGKPRRDRRGRKQRRGRRGRDKMGQWIGLLPSVGETSCKLCVKRFA